MRVVIIGAGAAGCFASIEIKRQSPDTEVIVMEKGRKALAKVAVTGGGRCNLTNSFRDVRSLEQIYPRGHRLMKKLLHHFSHLDAMRWFEQHGVPLVCQEDQCIFPRSQNAMQIVDTLLREMRQAGVTLWTGTKVRDIIPLQAGYTIEYTRTTEEDTPETITADKILITAGGQPREEGFSMLRRLSVEITPPVPSLFSLCIDDAGIRSLMGTVVEDAVVTIPSAKMRGEGALLLTHWGISGPAVLRLSSVAARVLAGKDYICNINISWTGTMTQAEVQEQVEELLRSNPQKQISTVHLPLLNSRLWQHILLRSLIPLTRRCNEITSKDINRLLGTLRGDTYQTTGKNRFKDEFVTAGGVTISSLNANSMEARNQPEAYFAGEITDIDAVTGGFNLQAAWTTAWVAAHGIITSIKNT